MSGDLNLSERFQLLTGCNIADTVKTVSQCSLDKSNDFVLVESDLKVYDFDLIKTKYFENYGVHNEIKSCDALFYANGIYYLVEFKNSPMLRKYPKDVNHNKDTNWSKDLYNVHVKVRDSLLILNDLLDQTISISRKNVTFILVYSAEKNPLRTYYRNTIRYLAKELPRYFGLNTFEGIYFNSVWTLTPSLFNKVLDDMSDFKGDLLVH